MLQVTPFRKRLIGPVRQQLDFADVAYGRTRHIHDIPRNVGLSSNSGCNRRNGRKHFNGYCPEYSCFGLFRHSTANC